MSIDVRVVQHERETPTVGRLMVESKDSLTLQASDFDRLVLDLEAGELRCSRRGVTRTYRLADIEGFDIHVKDMMRRWKLVGAR